MEEDISHIELNKKYKFVLEKYKEYGLEDKKIIFDLMINMMKTKPFIKYYIEWYDNKILESEENIKDFFLKIIFSESELKKINDKIISVYKFFNFKNFFEFFLIDKIHGISWYERYNHLKENLMDLNFKVYSGNLKKNLNLGDEDKIKFVDEYFETKDIETVIKLHTYVESKLNNN